MAKPGIKFDLTEKEKDLAVKYAEESGFYKNRLAAYLSISAPTLYKLLEEDEDFFIRLKRADTIFCKSLIESVKKKDPVFLLTKKFREEF